MTLVPYDNREGVIWKDGEMIPWKDAKIHVLNHGLHYASCVFEGIRVYNGKIFKLNEHTERLKKSAEILGFELPYSVEQLNEVTEKVVRAQDVLNGYIRPVAWRGSEMMAISTRFSRVHVAIAAWDWGTYFSEKARSEGLRLHVSKWARPAPNTAPTNSKAAGLYMICTLSKHAAEEAGYDDALMYDWRGYVAEATGANLFFVMKGELHTPTPDCFLDGITRRTVIDLAKKRGIKVVERHIKPDEIGYAEEAFLTGTAAEVTPIRQIGDYLYTVGNVTRQLMDDYRNLVTA